MTNETLQPALAGQVERVVGRLEPERASACGLTECRGKPACPRCVRWQASDDGMPDDHVERYLRRLLAASVGLPQTYYDDGEAQGLEQGISIDFMRETVAGIDAKLLALGVARYKRHKPDAALRLAAQRTREDLGPAGNNYPEVRALLAFAEDAIKSGRA